MKDLPCKSAERRQKRALQNDTVKYSLRHLVHILQHFLKCQWCHSVDFLSKNIVSQDILFHYQTHCHLHKTCNGRTQGYIILVSPLCTINYTDDTKISHEVQILLLFYSHCYQLKCSHASLQLPEIQENTASSYHDHCGEQTILCIMLSCQKKTG